MVECNVMKRANDVNNNNVYDVNIRHCYGGLKKQTDRSEKDNFTLKCTVIVAIFEDSVRRVIPVAVKINKMAKKRISSLGSK